MQEAGGRKGEKGEVGEWGKAAKEKEKEAQGEKRNIHGEILRGTGL